MPKNIKFRVWGVNENKWIDHSVVITAEGKLKKFYVDEQERFHCFPLKNDDFIIQLSTGLKDLHKKEIFEGDIIKFMGKWDKDGNVLPPDYLPYEVCWVMGGFRALLISRESWLSIRKHNEDVGVGHTDSEIIGNIMENPELLDRKW